MNDSSAMLSPKPAAPQPDDQAVAQAVSPAASATEVVPPVTADARPSQFRAEPLPAPPKPRVTPFFGVWLNRSRRVLLTLAVVWVISIFDLGFTLLEWNSGYFVELNPVAERLLAGPSYMVALFKFGLTGLGTVILLCLRRHSSAEWACWFLLAAKLYVAIRWFTYFDAVTNSLNLSPLPME